MPDGVDYEEDVMRRFFLCGLLALAGGVAWGQAPMPTDLQPIEDGAPTLETAGDAEFEPEVTIRREGTTQFREHRINGRLYKVQVVPEVGPSYYLIDHRGNGEWTRIEPTGDHLIIPQWVILRF